MRVIITGGTGLIGKALANSLAKDHHEVIVLSRNPNRTSGLDGSVKVVGWDARTAQGWGELADGAGAIVNLAGESIAGEGFPPKPWTAERKRRIRDSRIHAGKAVVEAIAAAQTKPGVLIQSSAVGYYGMQGDRDLTEESPIGGDFQAQVCKDWEDVTQPVENMGVRRVVIRTGIVMTTRGGVLPLMALPFRLFVGGPIGSGKQQISWIHLDDEIAAIRFLMENTSTSGAYNLSAPDPQTNAALGRAIGRALGRPSWLPAPGFAFKLAFGELSTVLLDGQRVLPKRLLEAGFTHQQPELEAALRDVFTNGK